MTLTWRTNNFWLSRSECGYYAVRRLGDPRNTAEPFEANHIPMLWSRAVPIGTAATLELAQALCDNHHQTNGPDFTG